MMDVRITNFMLVRQTDTALVPPTVAVFDAELGNIIQLRGCKVARRANGSLIVATPVSKLRRKKLEPTAWFLDKEMHRQFSQRAIAAYRALVGNQGLSDATAHDETGNADDTGLRRILTR